MSDDTYSQSELLKHALARAESLEMLVQRAAVAIAYVQYGKYHPPVDVHIGEYVFHVIGDRASIVGVT